MKKQLLIAAMLVSMAAANAQEVIYEQDFEGDPEELYDEGWYVAVGSGEETSLGIFNSMPVMQSIGINGNAIGATTFEVVDDVVVHIPDVDVVIITPVIDLPEGAVNLSYRVGSLAVGAGGSHYSVYVLTQEDMTGLQSDADLMDRLNTKTPTDSATISGQSSLRSYSITDYAGQPVAIAFRLHDTAANTAFLFDDIAVTASILGTGEVVAKQFAAYPNPVKDIITVTASDNAALKNVAVTDLNGRTVMSKQFTGAATAQIDLSGLQGGVYMLSVTSDKGLSTKKIVKQ